MTIATNNITDELGTGAPDFPQGMPTVGGDPIVESGSNSDGTWTKFAEGTLIQQALIIVINNGAGVNGSKFFSFPVAFFERDTATTNVTQRNATASYCHIIASTENTTQYRTYLRDEAGNPAGSTIDETCTMFAFGRWK